MRKHRIAAVAIYVLVAAILVVRDGIEPSLEKIAALGVSLLLILGYRKIAHLSKIGPLARLASDYDSEISSWPYAAVLWALFLLFCGFALAG